MQTVLAVLSVLGVNGLILYFVKRYFDKRDQRDAERDRERQETEKQWRACYETIRLLSYSRISEELESLLNKGYATPTERSFVRALYDNYKAHGWNGDMESRMEKVYALRTDHAPHD